MSRWEDKYNKMSLLSNEEINQKISTIHKASLAERKEKGPELDAELATLENFKQNRDKIRNIIEYRKLIEEKIEEYYKTLDLRTELKKQEKLQTKNLLEEKKLSSEIEALSERLKNSTDNKEKQKINKKITKKATEKQEKFTERMSAPGRISKIKEDLSKSKYGSLEEVKLRNGIKMMGATIVKCDMACSNLMKGKAISDIAFDKDKVRYIRPKRKEESPEKTEEQTEKKEYIFDEVKPDSEAFEKAKSKHEEEIKDYEESEVKKKHPRLASLYNKVKSFFKNRRQRALFEGEQSKEQEEVIEKPEESKKPEGLDKKELSNEEIEAVLNDDNALAQLAEKGVGSFRDSLKYEVTRSKMEKIDTMRKKEEVQAKKAARKKGPKAVAEAEKKYDRGGNASDGYRAFIKQQDELSKEER